MFYLILFIIQRLRNLKIYKIFKNFDYILFFFYIFYGEIKHDKIIFLSFFFPYYFSGSKRSLRLCLVLEIYIKKEKNLNKM